MVQIAEPSTPVGGAANSPPGGVTEQVLRCWLMTALGLLLLGVGLWDFRQAQEFGFMRVAVLVAEIAAGVGMAFCFGGAMHYADRALEARGGVGGGGGGGMRWYWRGIFVVHKRLLMVGQLVAVGIIVASLGAIIFDQPIPGPDYSMLERGWIPPQTGP